MPDKALVTKLLLLYNIFPPYMPTPVYLTQHQNRFLEELMDWLRIPSVSADPKFHGDVLRAADFLAERLREAGATHVELLSLIHI